MRVISAGLTGKPIVISAARKRVPILIKAGLRGPAGAGGVGRFNGRQGDVSLRADDVRDALGFAPVSESSLSAVATTGSYADLSGKPSIPESPADIGAATAAQGALADTAVQSDELDTALIDKVDKVAGYGLSQESFTTAEKSKLAGLESSHFKGLFAGLAALEDALPAAVAGDYADVDEGIGSDTIRYLWDVDDEQWVPSGSGAPMTAAQVKVLYEANADTNAFTDAEKSKLSGVSAGAEVNPSAVSQAAAEGGTGTTLASWTVQRVWQAVAAWWAASAMKTKLDNIAIGATANATDADLRDRSTHTGSQAISTITGLADELSGKQAALTSGTSIKTLNGQSLLGAGNIVVEGGTVGYVAGAVGATFDGGGAVIAAGSFCDVTLPYALTIDKLTLVASPAGDAVIDVRVVALADFPPAAGDSITGSSSVELDGATTLLDSTLSDWTAELAAGSVVRFLVVSAATITKLNIVLSGVRV